MIFVVLYISVVGMIHMANTCLRHPEQITFVDTSIWAGILYGFAGLLASFLITGQLPQADVGIHVLSISAVLLFWLGMQGAKKLMKKHAFVGMGHHTTSMLAHQVHVLRNLPEKSFFVVIGIVWFVRIYDIAMGAGFSGLFTLEYMLNRPYYFAVLDNLAMPFAGAFWFLYFGDRKKSIPGAMLLNMMAIGEVVYAFTKGRRAMVLLCVMFVIAYFLKHRKIRVIPLVVMAMGVALMFTFISPFFLNMRTQLQRIQSESKEFSLAKAFREVDKTVDEGVKEKGLENLSVRLVTHYMWMTLVVSGMDQRGYMHGEVAFSAAMNTLPRFLRPVRFWHDNASFIQNHLGSSTFDASDSHPASAYADFGLLGCFFYGFIFGCVLIYIPLLSSTFNRQLPIFSGLILIHGFGQATSFELNMSSFFSMVRSIVLLSIIGFFIKTWMPAGHRISHRRFDGRKPIQPETY